MHIPGKWKGAGGPWRWPLGIGGEREQPHQRVGKGWVQLHESQRLGPSCEEAGNRSLLLTTAWEGVDSWTPGRDRMREGTFRQEKTRATRRTSRRVGRQAWGAGEPEVADVLSAGIPRCAPSNSECRKVRGTR